MNGFWEKEYCEKKEHRLLRCAWRVVNATIFRVLVFNKLRIAVLRLFGAKIHWNHIVYPSVTIFAPWNLVFTNGASVIGPRVEIYNKAKVYIGGQVVISQDAYLCTASHDVSSTTMALVVKPITICDNAWIAAKSVILPGVTVGEASVVGCASVVPKDVAPWTVVGGNPAKFIKKRELD